jgi:diguanylate cyclase (GGDEF)-like protein
LNKKHNLAFHLVMLLLISVTTILVFYKALVHLRTQIDEIKINSLYRVMQIGEDYDLLLRSNEDKAAGRLEAIFEDLRKLVLPLSVSSDPDMSAIARNYGLDYLLICDSHGLVIHSLDHSLKGKYLEDIMPSYQKVKFLVREGQQLLIDRVGLLTDSNTLYKAAWYMPSDTDEIMIYGLDIRRYLEDSYSSSLTEYIFGGFFENLSGSVLLIADIDLIFNQHNLYHALSGDWEADEAELFSQKFSSPESQILNSYGSVFLPLGLAGSTGLNTVVLRVSFDNEMIRQISLNLIFRALLGFVILAAVIYLIVYFFFKSLQKDREELMLKIIDKIRKGKFRREFLENNIFMPEIENGIIELAEAYQSGSGNISQNNDGAIPLSHTPVRPDTEEEINQLKEPPRTDLVTGLPSRIVLREYLEYETLRVCREKTEFGILLIKQTNLKALGDELGTNFADYMLNKMGSKLRSTLRGQDRIGRWDTDEFLLLLPLTTEQGMQRLIAKLRDVIAQMEISKNNKQIKPETVFGGAIYKPGKNLDNCLREAMVAIQESEHSIDIRGNN